jgi:hypothetical protein
MTRSVVLRLFVTLIAFSIAAQAAPENPRIQSITVSPNRVDAGASPSTGTVTLSIAPTSNVSVNLRSSNTQAATVPGSVVVPKGKTQAIFSITIGKPSATTTVSITAMLGTMSSANLVVQVPLPIKVQSVSLNPQIVAAGGSVLVVVKLNTLAPAGGQQVTLAYSPVSLVSGPSSVTVPERAVATEVQVRAGNPANQSNANIKASINDKDEFSATLTIKGAAPITPTSAFINPGRLRSEETGTLTVNLSSPAPSGGCSVSLSSSDNNIVSVPSTLTIPAGATTGRAGVTVKPVQKSGTITVTATLNGGSAKATVEIVGTR